MKGVFGLLTPMAIASMRWSFIPRTTASWRLRSRTACQVLAPRLYRQAPLNSIWEGSGNVQCLDVLRALSRDPVARDALFAELHAARSGYTA
jgi:alkylation response protein AidB-like acyl-CoA dehydrogenase